MRVRVETLMVVSPLYSNTGGRAPNNSIMSETIQMRTTQEQSGDYRVYAAKGDEPIKGLALHTDLVERLDGEPDYIAVTVSEDGAVCLDAERCSGSTFRLSSQPAVRHGYVTPQFVAGFGMEDIPTEETFDVEAFPSIGISDLSASDEEAYDEEQNSSAEDAADALFGEGEDSDEAEADADEEENVEISDEELDIAN